MSNSIRTPKPGRTAQSKRIAQAVDDEDWQKFRVSLKGLPTQTKLDRLKKYWFADGAQVHAAYQARDCDCCIRVDNYLKALARGGQIKPSDDYITDLVLDHLIVLK